MPYVACPSCGERGKIPPTLVGARIKCKKCGISFIVAPAVARAPGAEPAAVAAATATATGAAVASVPEAPRPSAEAANGGIAVDGLDASAWEVPTYAQAEVFKAEAGAEPAPHDHAEAAHAFEAHHSTPFKEYKVLWSRDKLFEGKFDVARLEEALNFLARQGWVVKAMSNPHLKDFGGGMKEEVVVLLER